MLEEKDYSFDEIKAILKASDKQGIDRKLERYGVVFKSSGRGNNRIYTIKHITDPFKVYAITKLGIPAQADFIKIRDIYAYFFLDDDFRKLPVIAQEAQMEKDGVSVSRKTITKWLNYLEHIEYVSFNRSDCLYYIIIKQPDGTLKYEETDRETYSKGWRIYFSHSSLDDWGPAGAYGLMCNMLGGHPYKKYTVQDNAIHISDIDELIEVLHQSFLNVNTK